MFGFFSRGGDGGVGLHCEDFLIFGLILLI